MNNIDIIAGARPNFMKIAPLIHAINDYNTLNPGGDLITYRLIHTGQHYDSAMSETFFQQLNIPTPHINLGAGSGTHAQQTAEIMTGYEKSLAKWKPELCVVVGDVNSTMACAIVAKKAWIKVAHIEGGIRSGDMKMPEEINRIVTDSISDYFFTTSETANQNLIKEGVSEDRIFFVGNTMIDSLLTNLGRLKEPGIFSSASLVNREYIVITLHRPTNVDDPERLRELLFTLHEYAEDKMMVFPMHPRTSRIHKNLNIHFPRMLITEPLPYLEFIYLIKNSAGIITDSGGITEEATVLGIPCMTLRDSTERPETVTLGTNELVGTDPQVLPYWIHRMAWGNWKKGSIPPLWDGKTSERIVQILCNLI
ncbi:MAG TPA: UDP-N-acetylglucosamine 2-epimerase (non-hydrolyzing) [Saprospiraceae bacterium]|nr:UDP-N-acetylglucosamine 2-epimerase (non-hydrolyzing) [Saprospiraceae bacterium]